MKRTVTLFMSLALCFLVTSCGGKLIKGAATIAGSGTVIYQSFDNVYGIIEDNIDAFSPRDVVRLRSAGETLASAKAEVYALVAERGTALEMVADLPELIPLFEKAKIAYIEANIIVIAQIDEFERADQMTLFAFQNACIRFDSAIVDALNSGGASNAQLVKDIVGFVILVGKIALPLVIL
jgi:hypothetical protein